MPDAVKAPVLWLAIGVAAGVVTTRLYVGGYLEHAQRPAGAQIAQEEVRTPRGEARRLPALRCTQRVTFDGANRPQATAEPYSRAEAEAAVHYAQQALETARRYGGSMAHKQAWALEAIAGYLDVLVCGYVGGGP
jgi:hypothetical protein